jgi:hypothetical protein
MAGIDGEVERFFEEALKKARKNPIPYSTYPGLSFEMSTQEDGPASRFISQARSGYKAILVEREPEYRLLLGIMIEGLSYVPESWVERSVNAANGYFAAVRRIFYENPELVRYYYAATYVREGRDVMALSFHTSFFHPSIVPISKSKEQALRLISIANTRFA